MGRTVFEARMEDTGLDPKHVKRELEGGGACVRMEIVTRGHTWRAEGIVSGEDIRDNKLALRHRLLRMIDELNIG